MIYSKLFQLQREFKAAKTEKNKYGNFYYRNFECMMDTLKPLLEKHQCIIVVNHQPQDTSNGVYINTKVTLIDIEDNSEISSTSTVWDGDKRERKELCNAQISGGSMSYGAKYALGFLLGVAAEKDPDSYEGEKKTNSQKKGKATMTLIKEATDIDGLMQIWYSLNDEEREIFQPVLGKRREELGIK